MKTVCVFVLLSLLFINFTGVCSTDKHSVYCYFTSWAVYRSRPAKYDVSNVDPNLCSIISYAFLQLGYDGTLNFFDTQYDPKFIPELVDLKKINPKLRIVVAVGGWNAMSQPISTIAGNATLRQTMVKSVVEFIKKYDLDGFEIDWEYPTRRDGIPEDRENFSILLKELKEGLKAANSNYLLNAAVLGAGKANITDIYEPKNVSDHVDYLSLMLFDLHTAADVNYTFHHSPIYASTADSKYNTAYNRELSVISGIETWLGLGANASKINLGVNFYGHSWTLANNKSHGLFADSTGLGTWQELINIEGALSYTEICLFNTNYTVVRDPEIQTPYQYQGDQWVSYDDPISVTLKARVVQEYKLAGMMIWDLDYDDFTNVCNGGRYPLLNAVNAVFNGTSVVTS